jgi:mono/diheme cytochrome c family protein
MVNYNSILLAAFVTYGAVAAPKESGANAFENQIKPFLQQYCYDCHGNGKHKGGLALDAYPDIASIHKARDKWELVMRNVTSGEMPPEEKPQPTEEQRKLIANWVESELFYVDPKNPDPGRVTIRRLNRAEYNNTIRDLVGVDFKPADDFPVDDVGYGFDNIGDVLSLSPILFEKYLAAAEKIMDAAIVVGGPKYTGPAQHFEAEKLPSTAEGGGPYGKDFGMALMKEGEVYTKIKIDQPGDYYLRARAFGQQAGNELPKLEFRIDDKNVGVKEVEALENSPRIYETKLQLEPGEKKLAAAYINNFRDLENPNPDLRDRNLFIDYIEVIGPLAVQPFPESHQRIFAVQQTATTTNAVAKQIIERFTKRAFRRPVEEQELQRLMKIFEGSQKEGDSFEESVKVALTAVLVSPHFLFRGEIQPDPNNPAAIHFINDYELASRLSYFLWSTMPDKELFGLARKKTLRENLDKQVQRMLADRKSAALIKNFADQWLQIRNLAQASPATNIFPQFNDKLRSAMQKETELFFKHIMRENRSALEFIDADYSYLNGPLAELYGVKDVAGEEFRRVSLKGTDRGGLLTQASILTITSNPTRTSPVKRGKWVLENILGTPPPPPPPDVPELKEDKEAVLSGSLRQRMEQHRSKALCASCHARMDPIGFGFENFDGIGLWRTKDGNFDIDPAGKLVTGETFQGPAKLKKILLETRKQEFLRCLTDKMLIYALGRGTEYYDKLAIEKIVTALEKDNYRFQTLVLEVVKSVPFQKSRGEGERKEE